LIHFFCASCVLLADVLDMTEEEWLNYTEPEPMLLFLRGRECERKLRLFTSHCCRRIWHLLDGRSQALVELAERSLDGSVDDSALAAAIEENNAVLRTANWYTPEYLAAELAGSTLGGAWASAWNVVSEARRALQALAYEESKGQAALARDIFGNPFRPAIIDPAWLAWHGGTVVNLAEMIYEERAFADLPILADALEEAGCYNQEILDHCRKPGEHVRGCWVVDLLLGKS
jgi:hypothetical protein